MPRVAAGERAAYSHRAILHADVAQLVEQLICNQQVAGSSPIVSSGWNCGGIFWRRGNQDRNQGKTANSTPLDPLDALAIGCTRRTNNSERTLEFA